MTQDTSTPGSFQNTGGVLLVLSALFFFFAIVRFGWVADDGFIVMRSIDHVLQGKGLVLNVGQRVQTFTSPAWALFLIPVHFIVSEPYLSLVGAGLFCSLLLTLGITKYFKKTPWRGVLVFLTLGASSSFLTYGTSGLENSLAYVLAAGFCLELVHKKGVPTRHAALLAGALVLTRMDYGVLLFPSLLLLLIRHPKKALQVAWPALLLLGSWFLFSMIYYGSPLPNTAYAKLNTSIPFDIKFGRGLGYLVDALYRDPAMVFTLGAAALGLFWSKISIVSHGLLAGVLAYLLYVCWIGGDFMTGRFLTVPLLVAILVLVQAEGIECKTWAILCGVAAFPALQTWNMRLADSNRTDCLFSKSGIADERACYMQHTGLAQNIGIKKWRTHGYLRDFREALKRGDEKNGVIVFPLVGMVGFADEKDHHIVEDMALSEPLLSRLKVKVGNARPGHYRRPLPAGYVDSLRSGDNTIVDPCVRRLYSHIKLVTTGPLFAPGRASAIWALNTSHRSCPAPSIAR